MRNFWSVKASEGQYPFARHDQTNADICKILEGLVHCKERVKCEQECLLDWASECHHIVQVSSEVQIFELPYHLSEYWKDFCGESFVRLGSKCEFATTLSTSSWNLENWSQHPSLYLWHIDQWRFQEGWSKMSWFKLTNSTIQWILLLLI